MDQRMGGGGLPVLKINRTLKRRQVFKTVNQENRKKPWVNGIAMFISPSC